MDRDTGDAYPRKQRAQRLPFALGQVVAHSWKRCKLKESFETDILSRRRPIYCPDTLSHSRNSDYFTPGPRRRPRYCPGTLSHSTSSDYTTTPRTQGNICVEIRFALCMTQGRDKATHHVQTGARN